MKELANECVSQQIEEEKLLKEENIPGLTICGQEHELQFLQQLSEHFDNLNKPSESEDEEGEVRENVHSLPKDEEEETETERKVRLGEMTPFGTVLKVNDTNIGESQIAKYLQQQEELKAKFKNRATKATKIVTSHKNASGPAKKRKKIALGTETVDSTYVRDSGTMLSERTTVDFNESSGSEYVPSSDEDSESEMKCVLRKRSLPLKKSSRKVNEEYESDVDVTCSSKTPRIKVQKELDDGNEEHYERRIKAYEKSFDTTKIMFYEFNDDHFKIPLEIWSKLYNYQKVGVQWLWELHQQGVGGILADEMGLGKTIQLITFLSGLFYSKLLNRHTSVRGLGPVLIVCPTTLMYQWVKEFHVWFPLVRVAIFHACGSVSGPGRKKNLIRDVWRGRGVLITSYSGMMQHSDEILRYSWHYAILDEGHKIRNPDAKVTLAVKQLKTPHRIILSGSPLQNNLEELWSLFDFIYPGKLGALPLFQAQFAVPITHGGYANATDTEVTIAYKCATVLKELISPYLLRRTKTDVKSHINLPEKNEQVLFCQLTDVQRSLYKTYIDSGEVQRIIEGQSQIFVGIINLRKICNHPDLFTGGPKLLKHEKESDLPEEEQFGFWRKSGKMIVLETLLKIWHKQKHKVLLFTQSKKMLIVLELFLKSCNYSFLKLDGGTYIGSRQPLIDQFNENSEYFIMLLTTKVGGLGVNLTGANRIVIFDPDWNPATDTQARERAWRIGQTKDVTIYRLISVGTIEEKMYHRQIFKQFLTNKVLTDPKQRRFFKSNDLFELFTLKESAEEGSTETGAIFAGTGSEINKRVLAYKEKLKKKRLREKEAASAKMPFQFSKSKIEKMRLIAQRISQKLTQEATASEQPAKVKANITESPAVEKSETRVNEELTTAEHHKKKKKKHKKSYFEGERVPYLISCEKAKSKVETKEEESEVKAVEDEYVLKKLFSKAGICSALQHDTIVNGGPPDFAIVEKEAAKIAEEAIKELKRSQEECFPAHTGIPNWTGKNGICAKNKRNKGALKSSDILDKIKKRNGIMEATTSEMQLLKDLKNFITSEGGTASTDRLVQTFQQELPASQTPLFRCLLNKFFKKKEKLIIAQEILGIAFQDNDPVVFKENDEQEDRLYELLDEEEKKAKNT